MTKLTIFFTGATGYIGGSVLSRLLKHKDAKDFTIKALVRDPQKAKRLQSEFGVEAIRGTNADHDKIEKLSDEADMVISTASADDLGAAQAFLRGMRARHARTGKASILIHTSGTSVIADNAGGSYAAEKVFEDANVEDIESLPLTQLHRPVDVAITLSAIEGFVKSYIVLPSTIFGIAKTILTEAGIQNPVSIQIPSLILASLDRGQGGMVGQGKNIWADVHIDDIAELYMILFDRVRADPDRTPNAREGYYFGCADEYRWYDVCKLVAEELYKRGKSKTPEPVPFTKEELDKYYGGSLSLGTNSRCKCTRSRSLGWVPKKGTKDLMKSIREEEIDVLIKEYEKGRKKIELH